MGTSDNGKADDDQPVVPSVPKLLFAAGGIYFAFLYYGSLQEDVFNWTSQDGKQFEEAWLLQTLEALANVVVGLLGILWFGGLKSVPWTNFALSGVTQVSAKAFTSLSLALGVSFPVVTLGKSGKMAPVMVGSLLLGGESYSLREYLSVLAIIAGTCMVSMGKKSTGEESSWQGLLCIAIALACDGLTAGVQQRMKVDAKKKGYELPPFDFQFCTNLFMMLAGAAVSLVRGEFTTGLAFCTRHPHILNKILIFCLCSAFGQCFIFYSIAVFSPLICTMVTTTRKVFSVLLSILLKGHALSPFGWSGLLLACAGIMSEVTNKHHGKHDTKKTKEDANGAEKEKEEEEEEEEVTSKLLKTK